MLVSNLKAQGFLSNKGYPTRNCKYLNYSLSQIITNYRKLLFVLLKRFAFSDNLDLFYARAFYFLKYSCALTICSKMKLKSLRKTFKRYGPNLSVKENNKIYSFKAINYKSLKLKINR